MTDPTSRWVVTTLAAVVVVGGWMTLAIAEPTPVVPRTELPPLPERDNVPAAWDIVSPARPLPIAKTRSSR